MTKPEPYRLVCDAYPIGQEITTRVSDIDGNGHLNAIRIGKFYEEARASFYKLLDHGKRHPRLLVAEHGREQLAARARLRGERRLGERWLVRHCKIRDLCARTRDRTSEPTRAHAKRGCLSYAR